MKEVEWGVIHGEGTVVCCCDQCSASEEFEFDDGHPDYREAQRQLFGMGWIAEKIKGQWHDFCCEDCRNRYIKENT